MRKILFTTLIALIALTSTDAMAKRKHVRVYKPSPPATQVQYPLAVVPPALIAFDLVRRTSCDPRIAVSTGKGDPGFDPAGPLTGNFLWPAINRKDSYCYKPKF